MRRSIGEKASHYRKCASLSILLVAGVPAVLAAAQNPLRSPWDGNPVAATDAAYSCSPLPQLAPDLVTDGFYRLDDPTHSIIDPVRQEAYNKSSGEVKSVGLAIVKAADAYRTSGSRQAAECATNRIVAMAKDKSLSGKMSSGQAYYVQGWVVGAVAIAYLKVRAAGYATPEQARSSAGGFTEHWRADQSLLRFSQDFRVRERARTIICIGLESSSRQLV